MICHAGYNSHKGKMMDARKAVADTFEDVERLIWHTVSNFVRVTNVKMDVEDLIQEANLVFLKVYKAYDSTRGTQFSTLLVFAVKNRLIDIVRNEKRHFAILNSYSLDLPNRQGISPKDWLISPSIVQPPEVSRYATFCMNLALHPPAKVKRASDERGGSVGNLRKLIREYLKKVGWKTDEVSEAFQEIQEAVS